MIDPNYTNTTEYQEDLSLLGVIKNHWALISGTVLGCLFTGIVAFALIATFVGFALNLPTPYLDSKILSPKFIISLCLIIYAVAGMICWGFVTNNKKNILARIVRPWQIRETTKAKAGTVTV